MRLKRFYGFLLLAVSGLSIAGADDKLNQFLQQAQFSEGIAHYQNLPTLQQPDRFALATLHFLNAVEDLQQSFYRFGLKSQIGQQFGIPFLRLPVPDNPNPIAVKADDIAAALSTFAQSMGEVAAVLQSLSDAEFKTTIDLTSIRLDFDGDGKLSDAEYFYNIFAVYNRNAAEQLQSVDGFPVTFDLADAYWLKGYANLLLAISNMWLAYDGSELFAYTAQLFFKNPKTPYAGLFSGQSEHAWESSIMDAIAMLHMLRLPVEQPDRMLAARQHLLEVVTISRKTWVLIEQESDDEREWLPNPKQHSVTGVAFDQAMIDGWFEFLDEVEALLEGKKLIPHWRIKDGRGVNLKKVFTEPTVFDLVLWVHGSAALPYLEHGVKTDMRTWRRLQDIFQGDFIGFAIWIN